MTIKNETKDNERWIELTIKDYVSIYANSDVVKLDDSLKESIDNHILFLADKINKEREEKIRLIDLEVQRKIWAEQNERIYSIHKENK